MQVELLKKQTERPQKELLELEKKREEDLLVLKQTLGVLKNEIGLQKQNYFMLRQIHDPKLQLADKSNSNSKDETAAALKKQLTDSIAT